MSDCSSTETQTRDNSQQGREEPLEAQGGKKEVGQVGLVVGNENGGAVMKADAAASDGTSDSDKAKNTLIWIIKNLDKEHTDTLLKSKSDTNKVICMCFCVHFFCAFILFSRLVLCTQKWKS